MNNAEKTIDLNEARLEECEQEIAKGLSAFYQVGKALSEIRKSRLYKADYVNFESYCSIRWDMQRQRAYELMSAAEVRENIEVVGNFRQIPEIESHCKPLAKLKSAEEQVTAWSQVLVMADGKKVTAKLVTQVVDEILGLTSKSKPETNDAKADDGPKDPVAEKIMKLTSRIAELKAENARLKVENANLDALTKTQAATIVRLQDDLDGAIAGTYEPYNFDVDVTELDGFEGLEPEVISSIKWLDTQMEKVVEKANGTPDEHSAKLVRVMVYEASTSDLKGDWYETYCGRRISKLVEDEISAGSPYFKPILKTLKRRAAKQFHPDRNGEAHTKIYAALNALIDEIFNHANEIFDYMEITDTRSA
jgi:hypothetical protein